MAIPANGNKVPAREAIVNPPEETGLVTREWIRYFEALQQELDSIISGGVGSVTSVGLSMPAEFIVANSPVTTTGVLTVTKANEAANTVYAGPASGPPAAPTFRILQAVDIPNIAESQVTNLVTDLASKAPVTRNINTTAPLTGGGNLSADRTLGVSLATSSTVGVVKPDNTTITIDGTGKISASAGSSLLLQTNAVNNGSQAKLDLTAGSNITITDDGIGDVTIASSFGPSGVFAINWSLIGQPNGGSSSIALFVFTEAVNFPANWSGSIGKVGTNPTGTQTWTLNKNGSSVGTVSISTGGVITFTSSGAISFVAGDFLTLVGSGSVDATLANVDIDLYGMRASVTSTPICVIPFSWLGQVPASQLIGQYVCVNAFTLPGNFSGAAYGKVGTNPASTWTATIYKNGVSCGTISVSTSGVFTFTSTSGAAVVLVAGDRITVISQASTDTALQNIAFTFSGSTGGFVQLGGDLGGTSVSPVVIGIGGYSDASADDTGAANAYVVTTPYSFILAKYAEVTFKATNANTAASTLNVNGGGAVAIKKGGSTALASGDIAAGQIVSCFYDGTNWQMLSWPGTSGGSSVPTAINTGVDWPPASPGTFDDEFTAGSLSGSWAWNNQGSGGTGAIATVANSRVSIAASTQSGYNMHSIFQSAPSPTWEVTAEITSGWALNSVFNFAGLIIRESSTDKRSMIVFSNQGVSVERWSSSSSGPSNLVAWGSNYTGRGYFRIKYDGTNVIYSVSFDGVYFQQMLSEAKTASFTSAPDQLGLCASSAANNGPSTVCSCDWFRRTV